MFEPTRIHYDEVPYIPWKGRTFNQVTSSIQKNISNGIVQGNLMFIPPPLKIYRKEIATASVTNCNPRISTKIDEINAPGGYLVNPTSLNPSNQGISNTLDINITNNRTELPGTCTGLTHNGVCLDPATNARNRVRSGGMIRKTVIFGKIPEPYCTTAQQYLATRGRSFNQNQYNFLRKGDSSVKPGSVAGENNQYAVNTGINYCDDASNSFIPVYYKPNNPKFAQEGGVSSSSRIARLKYDTITRNGAAYSNAYGSAVGNALAYGVASDTYTVKDKIGFPNKCTPVFSKYKDGFTKCSVPPLAHMV